MATTNDITGDRLINTPKKSPELKATRGFTYDMPVFKVYYCDTCFIKVSTSNDCCPCCGKDLANG